MIVKKVKNHVHRWKESGRSVEAISFKCRCGRTKERPCTKEESKAFKKELDESLKEVSKVHETYHAFNKQVIDGSRGDIYLRLASFIKKHPEVTVARCDDDRHCGSDIVLIPHSSDKMYIGLTMVYIPQCTGEKPTRMFLYPESHSELIKALTKKRSEAIKTHGNKWNK